jgi:hypothetical protein
MKIDKKKRIWDDADINEAINDAIIQVQVNGDYNWTFNKALTTISTIADQQEYDVPTDFQRMNIVKR